MNCTVNPDSAKWPFTPNSQTPVQLITCTPSGLLHHSQLSVAMKYYSFTKLSKNWHFLQIWNADKILSTVDYAKSKVFQCRDKAFCNSCVPKAKVGKPHLSPNYAMLAMENTARLYTSLQGTNSRLWPTSYGAWLLDSRLQYGGLGFCLKLQRLARLSEFHKQKEVKIGQ